MVRVTAYRFDSTNLDHLEIFFADATLWTHKVFRNIFPFGAGSKVFFLVTFGLIVNPAADNTLPFSHSC